MIKRVLAFIFCLIGMVTSAHSQATGLVDLKFGQYQIADSQWNVSACMYTNTCQIYSKNPGIAYKIPWTSGQISWAAGDYIKFVKTGDATNPWNAVQYTSAGVQKAVMGSGRIINMGNDFFFFVGNDNNTGQLFSMTTGMNTTAGVTWTGTLNPTVSQVDQYAASNGSTTPLAAGQSAPAPAPAPTLCCGGSAAPFSANATNIAKVQTFVNRTTQDSKVIIEQIGNQNSITVNQEGTRNNYVNYSGNGSSNDIHVKQVANNNSQTNYVDLTVIGNYNTVDIRQQTSNETGSFGKGVFATITDNNNSLTIQQKNSGSHYAEVNLSGGNKSVNITQEGSAGHMASVTLSGQPMSLTLQQSGSGQNFYSIQFNCGTSGGCAPISVTQTK